MINISNHCKDGMNDPSGNLESHSPGSGVDKYIKKISHRIFPQGF